MLPAYAQVTVSEFKSYCVLTGVTRDQEIERAIDRASIDTEQYVDRRLIYRAPTEDDDAIVALATIATGALALAGQPNSAGRTLVVSKTDADHSLTAGVLTVTGTVGGVAGTTETFDLSSGDVLHGVKFFTAVTAAALTGCAGQTSVDKVKVGVSAGYTEYHSPYEPDRVSEITPIEWPVQNVVEVNEDVTLAFGTGTALTSAEYQIRSGSSISRRVVRISNLLDFPFITGRRAVRLRYSAGYKGAAAVPSALKGFCLELAAWHYQYADKKDFGFTSRTDALGSTSRSGPPMITSGMASRLASYQRIEFDRNAERDFDLEAA